MFAGPSRKGFTRTQRVPFNKYKDKMSAPNNATYVLTISHAGLPNSKVLGVISPLVLVDADISWDFSVENTWTATQDFSTIQPRADAAYDLGSDGKIWNKIFVKHAQTQPVRALDIVYQNTTGHPIIVYGDVHVVHVNSGNDAKVDLKTDGSNPPTTVVQEIGAKKIGFGAVISRNDFSLGFYMVVADDDYYTITKTVDASSTLNLGNWNEVDF